MYRSNSINCFLIDALYGTPIVLLQAAHFVHQPKAIDYHLNVTV